MQNAPDLEIFFHYVIKMMLSVQMTTSKVKK